MAYEEGLKYIPEQYIRRFYRKNKELVYMETNNNRECLALSDEVQGYPVTEENVAKLRNICEHHSFTDFMAERGWDEYDAEYKCNICREAIEDDEESLWAHIQMDHKDIFEECQNW